MFVRSPEYMVEWFAIGRRDEDHASVHLDIHEPDAPPSYRYLLPFDPSSAGLFNPVEFTVARTPPQIMEPLLADSVQTTVQTNAVGEIELTFMLFEGRLRRRFTIDPANGFTATRMEIVQFDESGQLEELPRLESTADWERRGDDVWVPVRISVVRHVPSGNRDAYEYDLHWESVNPSAFDDELFTWQSFEGVWDGTHVVDRRQGKLEHIDTIGKPFVKIPSAAERAGVPLDQPKPLSPTRYWLIVVNAIALGILGVILIVRGLRKRRTPAP